MKKRIKLLIPVILGLFLTSCGGGGGEPAETSAQRRKAAAKASLPKPSTQSRSKTKRITSLSRRSGMKAQFLPTHITNKTPLNGITPFRDGLRP